MRWAQCDHAVCRRRRHRQHGTPEWCDLGNLSAIDNPAGKKLSRGLEMGKNLVSDGHFCKSFCPAQPKISISSDLKHCYHLLTHPDCVMSEIHDILQNKILRNQLIMAASVMEFPSTTLKYVLVEKIFLQN